MKLLMFICSIIFLFEDVIVAENHWEDQFINNCPAGRSWCPTNDVDWRPASAKICLLPYAWYYNEYVNFADQVGSGLNTGCNGSWLDESQSPPITFTSPEFKIYNNTLRAESVLCNCHTVYQEEIKKHYHFYFVKKSFEHQYFLLDVDDSGRVKITISFYYTDQLIQNITQRF